MSIVNNDKDEAPPTSPEDPVCVKSAIIVVDGNAMTTPTLGLDDEEFIVDTIRLAYFVNALAGHHSNEGWEALDKQIAIISSEFNNELVPAVATRDLKEVRDGLADTLFTLLGFGYRAGINVLADLEAVCLSNCSKFDNSILGADLTVQKYKALGIEVYQRTICVTANEQLQKEQTDDADGVKSGEGEKVVGIVTYSAKDQVGTDGKHYQAHKWLKSFHYHDPEFKPMDPGNKLLETRGDLI